MIYCSPVIEVIKVAVEKGFAGSPYDDDTNVVIPVIPGGGNA